MKGHVDAYKKHNSKSKLIKLRNGSEMLCVCNLFSRLATMNTVRTIIWYFLVKSCHPLKDWKVWLRLEERENAGCDDHGFVGCILIFYKVSISYYVGKKTINILNK